ncbi:MAG: hypothetical protein HN764_12040 [Gammaproteobacteria bacterium]|jgi:hypothetical protein|nr:hypothetical protein [Gammaproteobacteria bacterium]
MAKLHCIIALCQPLLTGNKDKNSLKVSAGSSSSSLFGASAFPWNMLLYGHLRKKDVNVAEASTYRCHFIAAIRL